MAAKKGGKKKRIRTLIYVRMSLFIQVFLDSPPPHCSLILSLFMILFEQSDLSPFPSRVAAKHLVSKKTALLIA